MARLVDLQNHRPKLPAMPALLHGEEEEVDACPGLTAEGREQGCDGGTPRVVEPSGIVHSQTMRN